MFFAGIIHQRSDPMKTAYGEELGGVMASLEAIKIELETWYSKRVPDAEILGAIKDTYDDLMNRADGEINRFTGTTKTIKTAIVSQSNLSCTCTKAWDKVSIVLTLWLFKISPSKYLISQLFWGSSEAKSEGEGESQSWCGSWPGPRATAGWTAGWTASWTSRMSYRVFLNPCRTKWVITGAGWHTLRTCVCVLQPRIVNIEHDLLALQPNLSGWDLKRNAL